MGRVTLTWIKPNHKQHKEKNRKETEGKKRKAKKRVTMNFDACA